MIRSLTGCRVRVVGKPSADALRAAAERLGVPAPRLAVVGDDPELEVPMAHRGRALAVAVGTGLGGAGSYDGVPASRRPHLQVAGVDELLAMLQEALRRRWRSRGLISPHTHTNAVKCVWAQAAQGAFMLRFLISAGRSCICGTCTPLRETGYGEGLLDMDGGAV
jgi:hypothetical protein